MPSGRAQRAIGIVSRAPIAGSVKTRLASEIGNEAATVLYAAFLRDVLVNSSALESSTITVFHPAGDDRQAIVSLCPPGTAIQPEVGRGYTEILPGAIRNLLDKAPLAALLGADSPGLPQEIVIQAFEAIESGRADVAIGPASDGGYYLLAANGDYPDLFRNIDWGTDRVFDQMTGKARGLGLRLNVLSEWYDVDDLDGLGRLANDLAANARLGAEATRSALRRLRDSGHPIPSGQPAWRTRRQESIYQTPWRSLVEDELETHAGERIHYAYLETDHAVWVVPVTPDGRIILIRQYRHPIGEFIVEVPAGGGAENPADLARRELAEETGGVAGLLIHIADYYPASAHLTHKGRIYVALDVVQGKQDLESTELLSVFSVPFDLALDMARRGEIGDSQSALAILAAEPVIRAALNPE